MTTFSIPQKLSLALAGATLATLATAHASQALTLVTDRTALDANETLDWSVLGPQFTSVDSPLTAPASGGTQVTGSLPSGSFQRRDQSSSWSGNFASGEALLWNLGNGPMQFSFSNALRGGGAQIQNNFFGPFTAVIEAFNSGGTSLGSVTRAGDSTGAGDGSAIFIGLLSDQADIARITFNVNGSNSFAINNLSLNTTATAIPTPALLPGLIGLGVAALRKRKAEAVEQANEA